MKTYGYICRDNLGALKKGTLQALDRSDALRQIKAMDCIPVSVNEGSTISSNARVPWNPAWNKAVGLSTIIIVLIVALTVWQATQQKPTAKHLAFVKNTVPKPIPHQNVTSTVESVQAVSISNPALSTVPIAKRDGSSQMSAKRNMENHAEPATEATRPQTPQRPRPYNSATEQLLAMAMSVPPGARMPPLPIAGNLDKDFANSLTNTIVIYDDDDEHTANIKENVAVAKTQLLEALKQGRSVADVLKEYQESTNEKAAARTEALQEVSDLYRAGKTAEAQAYLEKVNKAFKDLGVEPVSLPIHRNP